MSTKKILSALLAVAMVFTICTIGIAAIDGAEAECTHDYAVRCVETEKEPYPAVGVCYNLITYIRYRCTVCDEIVSEFFDHDELVYHDWDLISIECNGDDITDTYTYRCVNEDCGSEYYDEEQTPCTH